MGDTARAWDPFDVEPILERLDRGDIEEVERGVRQREGRTPVKWSSSPLDPPGSVQLTQLAVAPAQEKNSVGFAWPKGRSRLWPSPVPNPSLDTTKFCTLSNCDIGSCPLGRSD